MNQRNRRYDRRQSETHRVGVPVICIGNLTLGGTGKTPMVHYVARWFRQRDVRVAIVSRGYGTEGGAPNDEAQELHAKLPDVPHIQNPDRVAACRLAIDELEMQVIVLDDGFQHRRLERDLDIVLIDALEPFGFGHVFPRGTLREPVAELKRAELVALSRADLIEESKRHEIRCEVRELAPEAKWIEVAHEPTSLCGGTQGAGNEESVSFLRDRRIVAFCGLGNPTGFRKTLERCGANVLAFQAFPDHHAYARDDIDSLKRWIHEQQPDMAVCTHKDFVKIEIDELAGVPLRALMVELGIQHGQNELHAALESVLGDVV